MKEFHNLVAFDGVCNFCNFWINKLLQWDKNGKYRFVSLQVLTGKGFIADGERSEFESVILFKDSRQFRKSDAVLEIARGLGFPFNLLIVFKIVPRFLRDRCYDLVARNRYRWFGRRDVCRIPTPEERTRFLDSTMLSNFAAQTTVPS